MIRPKRILVVDDEEAVRRLAGLILRRQGYEVIEAADVRDAVTMAWDHARPVDLLLTDFDMPGMNGAQVACILTAAKQGLPVLFVSGGNEAAVRGQATVDTFHFLSKPYSPATLVRKVRDLIEDRPERNTLCNDRVRN